MNENILELIGNTPLVKIKKLNPYPGVQIYAKLEGFNPGGSVKDRVALKMIEEAEKKGELDNNKTIIEPTSGNTGIGLAMVSAIKGYRIEIVMSEAVSLERRKVMEGFGAKIILSPAEESTDGAIKVAEEMVNKHPDKYFMPDQFNNKNNYLAHYEKTAEEILKEVPETDYFVAGLGTTGTLVGCAKKFKEKNPQIKVVAAEPNPSHTIQGLKNLETAIVPGIFKPELIDETIKVADPEAYKTARELIKKEGIFVGISSGAALASALKIAERESKNKRKAEIVVIFPDRAEKYLSTTLIEEDKMGMKIFNTLAKKKQEFVPLKEGEVSYYTCGPTVYDYAHIGNFRSYIFGDLLKRYLKYKGYNVSHVMNITDVEDKTIKGSRESGKSLKEYTEFYTDEFFKDFDALRIERPDIVPKATETIDEMVELVKKLLDKGYAYKSSDGSIYFDISKFNDYGKMAHLDMKGLKPGARVCQDEYDKEEASDFVLWKAYKPEEDGDVYWDTGLGKGRPGWHLECSAMSMKYLGESIDIHTGGIDLVFPHHQNEVAQSEAITGKTFVNYWVHCNHLIVEGKKMSKSLGNFFTIRDLLNKGYSPLALRYALLTTHYRQQLNLTMEGLDAAENAVERLNEFISRLSEIKNGKEHKGINRLIGEMEEGFVESLDDDLNISGAMAAVFEFIKKANRLIDEDRVGSKNAEKIMEKLLEFDKVLGLIEKHEEDIPKEVIELAEERKEARNKKDFTKADELRQKIKEKGYYVDDNKDGYRLKKL
ncbi:MAG: cysteine--tRNA ligase [Nanoarchaeota archaeon]